MKENNNNKEILIEEKPSDSEFSFPVNQEDLDMNEEPKKRCCLCNCCFYLFCCCCCHPDIKSNDFYKKKWKNYLYTSHKQIVVHPIKFSDINNQREVIKYLEFKYSKEY